MDVDTPVANTPTARAVTNVPRNGPAPAPRTVVATASAAAPATTPAPVPAPRGGTRPPPITSRTSETRRISGSKLPRPTGIASTACRTLIRLAESGCASCHRRTTRPSRELPQSRPPRLPPADRVIHQRSGTSVRRRQTGPPPSRSTGLSSVVATLQQLQRLLG
ncbi:uncharacterized protein DKFZp434B061-like [Bactrocera neohumeralis]|uniref:uncharacterized protein DKFZp434B061-like n=1 Tax=Bactrocera neohumeralis TaxID=98809 RepID=UPI00216629D5|nr:uncharacterized protein DKFZp434B061-like [Bactrocera neohumeralis]